MRRDTDLLMPILISGLAIFGILVFLAQCDAQDNCRRRGGVYVREFIGYSCVDAKRLQPTH